MNDKIRVIHRSDPGCCGGTDSYVDESLPKEIVSERIVYFKAHSALGWAVTDREKRFDRISAFAAPASEGTFIFLETFASSGSRTDFAVIKGDILPKLAGLVREWGLAGRNGFHSYTNGLPEDFGGSIEIAYDSGERISISDNQAPVLIYDTAERIAGSFSEALAGERVEAPEASEVKEIRFNEERENGGFTEAVLTFLPDGTAINRKRRRFDDPTVYESSKPLPAEEAEKLRRGIDTSGILLWSGLPDNGYSLRDNKRLTFLLEGGREIAVKSGRLLPESLSGGFFNIELQMTTVY